MRSVVVISLVLSSIFFGLCGANISFSLSGATDKTYRDVIQSLRTLLTGGAKAYDIPVLKVRSSVPISQRYILIDFIPYDDNISITIAIDVVDVYVVAFLGSDNRSFFLKDTPSEAYAVLFKDSVQTVLSYTGRYGALENACGKSREKILLGPSPLDFAITNLWYHNSVKDVPAALIVIIEMFSEAARFKAIEVQIANSVKSGTKYTVNSAILSLENNWSKLSSAILYSNDGKFKKPVTLRKINNDPIEVTSVEQAKSLTGIALLLYSEDDNSFRSAFSTLLSSERGWRLWNEAMKQSSQVGTKIPLVLKYIFVLGFILFGYWYILGRS